MASKKLTEYERKRLENIRRNDEMMAALKIHSKTTELSSTTKRLREGTKSKVVGVKKKLKVETPVVIRRSLRTRGLAPNSEGLDGIHDSLSVTKEPHSCTPIHLGPLSLKEALDETESDKFLIEAILGIDKQTKVTLYVNEEHEKSLVGGYGNRNGGVSSDMVEEDNKFGVSVKGEYGGCAKGEKSLDEKRNGGAGSDVDDVKEIEVKSCLKLESLTLNPENIARVFSGRIMALSFFPTSSARIIVTGNKFGNVGFWNVDCEEDSGVCVYRPHSAPISGILVQRHCLSKVFSSCYDGYIRLMDAEKEVFDLVYSSDETIFSLSQQADNTNCLYFSEGPGGLNIWDNRVGKGSFQLNLHKDRINSIDFKPQNPHIMATSSTDGTACIWDLRSINENKPKDLTKYQHKRAAHSAYFSPSGRLLATTSFDNTIGILSGNNFENVSTIYHDNQTSRWISSFKAIWGWDDSCVFVGNMKRGVDVLSVAMSKTIFTLQSPHISAIPCRFDAHPYEVGTLAGGTGGGQVYMWTSC